MAVTAACVNSGGDACSTPVFQVETRSGLVDSADDWVNIGGDDWEYVPTSVNAVQGSTVWRYRCGSNVSDAMTVTIVPTGLSVVPTVAVDGNDVTIVWLIANTGHAPIIVDADSAQTGLQPFSTPVTVNPGGTHQFVHETSVTAPTTFSLVVDGADMYGGNKISVTESVDVAVNECQPEITITPQTITVDEGSNNWGYTVDVVEDCGETVHVVWQKQNSFGAYVGMTSDEYPTGNRAATLNDSGDWRVGVFTEPPDVRGHWIENVVIQVTGSASSDMIVSSDADGVITLDDTNPETMTLTLQQETGGEYLWEMLIVEADDPNSVDPADAAHDGNWHRQTQWDGIRELPLTIQADVLELDGVPDSAVFYVRGSAQNDGTWSAPYKIEIVTN